jgi:hypothetical protein
VLKERQKLQERQKRLRLFGFAAIVAILVLVTLLAKLNTADFQ